MNPQDLTAHVRGLLEKYGKTPGNDWRLVASAAELADGAVWTLAPGWSLPADADARRCSPLLPWRFQRRFVELKRLVDEQTVTPLVMCRLCCMTDGIAMGLAATLYREFDLAEWLAGSPIVSLKATVQADRWANAILRLANGVVCGIEAGAGLPTGSAMVDRHELIARRGVACDRVVDSQVPQSSIYAFTGAGAATYTDTDAELFGLSADAIDLVRAACDLLADRSRAEALHRQHRRLTSLVRLALESDRQCRRLAAEGAC